MYLLCACCVLVVCLLLTFHSDLWVGAFVFGITRDPLQVYAQLGIVQMRVGHMWQAALSLQRALFHTNGQHLMGKQKEEGGGDEEKEETEGDRILESFL